jgi:hypothetical protein
VCSAAQCSAARGVVVVVVIEACMKEQLEEELDEKE